MDEKSALSSCGPTGKDNSLKLPASSVFTDRIAPVSRLFADTIAPLTAAPLESTTVPEIVAATWARNGLAIIVVIKKRNKQIGWRRLPCLPDGAAKHGARFRKAQRSRFNIFFIGKLTLVPGYRCTRACTVAADFRWPEA